VSLDSIALDADGCDELRAMAHAIRSPTNVIGAAVQELATAAQDDRSTLLAMVSRSVGRLGVLAERLDWLAELRAGRTATRVRCDAVELVKRAGAAAAARGPERKRLEVSTPDGPVPVFLDVALFEQAVRCLLENALSVARQRVLLQLLTSAGRVALVVEDDGPSFDPALFGAEPVAQVTDAQRRTVADLSLRLRIAELAMLAQEGTLTVDRNDPGPGMRYSLALQPSSG
jgi:signal transduction histidine kinase